MNTKGLISVVFSTLALGFAVFAVTNSGKVVETRVVETRVVETQTSQTPDYGAAGAVHSNSEQFLGGMTIGGGRVSSSTSANVTLAGNEFTNASYLDYTVNVANKTLTLPASTTPLCSTLSTYERREVFIRHASTTAASNLTIAGGTGFAIKKAATSTGSTIYGDTDGNSMAALLIMRLPSTDCVAQVTVYND